VIFMQRKGLKPLLNLRRLLQKKKQLWSSKTPFNTD